jgi:hypothetical protein
MIRPAAAEINPEPHLEVLTGAARSLSTRKAYEDIHIFASPSPVGQKGGFVPRYENNVVISTDASIHTPRNVWIHEYVHTRQVEYEGDNFAWFNEASATYYAARLSLEQGLISQSEYDAQLASFARYTPDANLASARTELVAYRWGAVVLARLDVELVDKGYTLMMLFNDWNSYSGPSFDDTMADLEKKGVSQSTLNDTRDTVLKNSPPDPQPAQTSQLQRLPDSFLSQYWKNRTSITVLLIGLGICALSSGIKEYWQNRD